MSYDSEIFTKAEREITARRLKAESISNRHMEEIEMKIPEISEINHQLADTSIELSRLILNKTGDFAKNLSRIKDNNLEGQRIIAELLISNGYPYDYMKPKYFCPICNDRGYIDGKRCGCFNDLLEKYSVEKLNSYSQINLYSFDTFDLKYYPKSDENGISSYTQMASTLSYCREYAKTFSKSARSIFMLGMTGLGKTHLSLAIAKEVIEKGFNVAYDSIVNYLRMIEKEHFGKADSDTLQTLLNVDLLIMDDLGSEYESSFYVSTIYNIINTRLNKGVPTIINSNLSPSELQKRYDERIVSRLIAMYDYLKFTGNDIRKIKKVNGEI